jgi:hypothetical protein
MGKAKNSFNIWIEKYQSYSPIMRLKSRKEDTNKMDAIKVGYGNWTQLKMAVF